ncbi:MAG: ribonuclease J [Candidatus Pacebacteria bacterium]|nr:ribonuclease J [Candidatus Paceibacterota bacterium]
MNTQKLRIIPLGGMGNVTKNMFAYEYDDEILLVDCGIGFPEQYMLGVDVLIPDVSYIQKRLGEGARIVGLCLTHGHDDHIAALPYILPTLPSDFEIYGSPLTAAFAQARMADSGVERKVLVYDEDRPFQLGKYFSVEPVRVTHSVPDTRHLIITTPEGVCYHGSDFKFDMNPVDGVRSDFGKIAAVGQHGILCALVDCLRVEREVWAPSESTIYNTLEQEIRDCKGKFFVTLMSSNIHRVQLAINVAINHGRKVVFMGRSIEQNAKIAQELGMLRIPKGLLVNKKSMEEYKDEQLCVIIAGSQGQPGSSLVRAVYGDHPLVTVTKRDKVVFSTEPIPGNEGNVYGTIDELSRNGVDVAYSDVDDGLHVSGHAGLVEQQLLISLMKAKYLFPIGGTDRHRVQFARVAHELGYAPSNVLLPVSGQVVEYTMSKAMMGETLTLKDLMVDGLGVGDVGAVVLADRKTMAEEGMVTVIIPEQEGRYDFDHIYVASRGFVFMKQADEMVSAIKETTSNVLREFGNLQENDLKKKIEKQLTKRLGELIGRTPLILPVFMEV